jgi:hypothetical protein
MCLLSTTTRLHGKLAYDWQLSNTAFQSSSGAIQATHIYEFLFEFHFKTGTQLGNERVLATQLRRSATNTLAENGSLQAHCSWRHQHVRVKGPLDTDNRTSPTSFFCISELFNSPKLTKLHPSRIRQLTRHVNKMRKQAVHTILVKDSLEKRADWRSKRLIEVNIKPDTAERRREVIGFNWLKTVANTAGFILSAFSLRFTKTDNVRIM